MELRTPELHDALLTERRRQLVALHVPAGERWWRRSRRHPGRRPLGAPISRTKHTTTNKEHTS